MTILIYDLETTGLLNPARNDLPGIIQIAAGKYDWDGNLIAEFSENVDPEISNEDWEAGAIKTTGIGPDNIGPDWHSFFAVFPAFAEFVEGSKILSGYNIVGYDNDVLYNQIVRYGFEKHFPWPRLHIDVMGIANDHYNLAGKRGNKAPKLGEIYQSLFGEELDGWHDAINDVRATARVFFEIGKPELARFSSM